MFFHQFIFKFRLLVGYNGLILAFFFPLLAQADSQLFSQAVKLMEQKKWTAAELKLLELEQKSLSHPTQKIAVFNNLGITYFYRNKPELARQYFIKAVESMPQTKTAFRNILQLNRAQQGKSVLYFKTLDSSDIAFNPMQPPNSAAIAPRSASSLTQARRANLPKPSRPQKSSTQEAREANMEPASDPITTSEPELSLDTSIESDDISIFGNDNGSDSSNNYLSEIDREIEAEIDFNSPEMSDNSTSDDRYLQDLFSQDTIVVDQSAPPKDKLQTASAQQQKQLRERLTQWAKTWSSGNAEQYMSFYSDNYAPPKRSRKNWIKDRRRKVTPAKQIRVTLSEVRVNRLQGSEHIVTRFRQQYRAKSYRDNTRKELHWQNQNGNWFIVREKSI